MRTFIIAIALVVSSACVDHADGDAPVLARDATSIHAANALPQAQSACDALVSAVFEQPQIGECLVAGTGFLVDGPSVADDQNPAMTWVSDVQGRPNPSYPDLTQDGVIVRRGVLGDCEWLVCIFKR